MPMLAELTNFLQNAHWPQIPERRPTFFSITKFPHYENVMSNVYQFFFSTENPHGLGSLCVDALLDVLETKSKKFESEFTLLQESFRWSCTEREVSTNSGRIDLLIHSGRHNNDWTRANALLIIENKVNHHLSNDLCEYWDFIDNQNPTQQKQGIILGLRHENILPQWQANWVSITHFEWAKAVERRLGSFVYRAEPRYLTLLMELIENIRTMTQDNETYPNLLRFFAYNRSTLFQALTIHRQAYDGFYQQFRKVLPVDYKLESQNNEMSKDGWLIFRKEGTHPLFYCLSYWGVFQESENDNCAFQITLIIENGGDAEKWRQNLVAQSEAISHQIEKHSEGRHYTVTKRYPVNIQDLQRLPEFIVEKVEQDWQPLEKYWESPTINLI